MVCGGDLVSKFQNSMLKFVNSKYGDNDTYDMDDIRIIASDSVIKNNKMQYLLFDFEQEVSPGKYAVSYTHLTLPTIA